MPPSPPLKAYIVMDVDQEDCDVIAAPSPGWAKSHADVDADFCDRRVQRLPEADKLIKDGKITRADAFMAELIYRECSKCYAMTSRDTDGTVVNGKILCATCATQALEEANTNA